MCRTFSKSQSIWRIVHFLFSNAWSHARWSILVFAKGIVLSFLRWSEPERHEGCCCLHQGRGCGRKQMQESKFFYDIYSKQETAPDTAKEKIWLFFFKRTLGVKSAICSAAAVLPMREPWFRLRRRNDCGRPAEQCGCVLGKAYEMRRGAIGCCTMKPAGKNCHALD